MDEVEETLVNAFSRVATIDEVWVRHVSGQVRESAETGTPLWIMKRGAWPLCRVYLGFRVLDPDSRTKADNIEKEFRTRMSTQRLDFEFAHVATGTVPPEIPARIWKRRSQKQT
jgi:hypothetical protein